MPATLIITHQFRYFLPSHLSVNQVYVADFTCMSVLDLYDADFAAKVSRAIQHSVPALRVRKVVWPLSKRLLMPKSANLALPVTSAGGITYKTH